MNYVPHRIEYEVDAFAPRKLCSRNKVGVTGDQNDLTHLALETEGRNIKPDAHINPLLRGNIFEILILHIHEPAFAAEELGQTAIFEPPLTVIHQMAKSERHLSKPKQLLVKFQSKNGLRSS